MAPFLECKDGTNRLSGVRTRPRRRRNWQRSRTVDLLQLQRIGTLCHDFTNPTCPSCKYFTSFDHEMEEFPTLITRICNKGVLPPQPTQNLQMMRSEPREEDPNVNIVLRSGITIGDDKGKQPKDSTWVHKALVKETEFDLECTREGFMEKKKSFTEASTSRSNDKPNQEMDPSMLTTFLDTCMKVLHDSKVVKGLQELINRCVGIAPGEPCVV